MRLLAFLLFGFLCSTTLFAQYGDCPTEGDNIIFLNNYEEIRTWQDDEWFLTGKDTLIYNENYSLASRVGQYWNSEFEQFVNSYRTFFEYNEAGQQEVYRYQSWNGAIWTEFLRSESDYNEEGQLIEQRDFSYSPAEDELILSKRKFDYIYDDSGNLSEHKVEEAIDGELQWTEKIVLSLYHESGAFGQQWTYSYEDGEWIGKLRSSRVFNSFGQLNNWTTYEIINGEEVTSLANLYFYDDEQQLNYVINQSYGNGEVAAIRKSNYLFDTCSNLVFLTHQVLDFATGEYLDERRQQLFYTGVDGFGVSIPEVDQSRISIYPQPAKGLLFVQGLLPSGGTQYMLSSLDGKVLSQGTCSMDAGSTSISIDGLVPGLYILSISSEFESFVKMISVK